MRIPKLSTKIRVCPDMLLNLSSSVFILSDWANAALSLPSLASMQLWEKERAGGGEQKLRLQHIANDVARG